MTLIDVYAALARDQIDCLRVSDSEAAASPQLNTTDYRLDGEVVAHIAWRVFEHWISWKRPPKGYVPQRDPEMAARNTEIFAAHTALIKAENRVT